MSRGFEKLVRGRVEFARRMEGAYGAKLEARAQALADGNTADELVELGAAAARAYAIKGEREQAEQVERVKHRRREVASAAAALGAPTDDHGNVRRLDAKRAIKGAQKGAPDMPAQPREAPLEPGRRPSGIVVPGEGELSAAEAAHRFEQTRVRRP